jgi:hypothetical protein
LGHGAVAPAEGWAVPGLQFVQEVEPLDEAKDPGLHCVQSA